MADVKQLNKEEVPKPYNPTNKELEVRTFLDKRIPVLYNTKKNIVNGIDFTEIMKSADKEYQPSFLEGKNNKSKHFVEDELTGKRGVSRLTTVDLESDDWRSKVSEPTLLVKVQTALSILIDQNPEAIFKATSEKYEKRNNIAKALYKRNWDLNISIETLKLFVFDLAKYGWAVGHTLPRKIERDKEILEEIDSENPENNKYRKIKIVEFDDVYREKLDPYRTWIDDKANLSDRFSVNDWYYEKDFSKDDFKREFGNYKHADAVTFAPLPKTGGDDTGDNGGESSEQDIKQEMVTVGFYENKSKDLYAIRIKDQGIVLYYSPLPNDDGKLTLWWTYWVERDPRTIYGIGLYELLKHNKVLYDRLKNMTVDQLVMAIYPMLFYTGKPMDGENEMKISPSKMIQKQAGTTIDQISIKYDGRGWDGVERVSTDIDNDTGITPTLEGEIAGKTLGETLHAKDSALKRLNIPLLNIAKAIEQDAYITLSWMNQIYSIPEVKEFADMRELEEYEKEIGKKASGVYGEVDEAGQFGGKVEGEFLPELDLGLEEDREGVLEESAERRFFQLGSDKLPLESIKWEGKIHIKARSIVSPNPELERQRKLELFNLVFPAVQMIVQYMGMGDIESALALYKPVKEILEIQDEEPNDWLPTKLVEYSENPEMLAEMQKAKQKEESPLFIKEGQQTPPGGSQGQSQASGQTVVPRSEVSNPMRDIIGKMKWAETKAMGG